MNWKEHHNYGKVNYSLGSFDLIVWRDEEIILYEGAKEPIKFGKIPIDEAKEKAFNFIIDKLSNAELRELEKETQNDNQT
jgi:hypothetical protein